MNSAPADTSPARPAGSAELLVLPDGRILAHNLTPALAALLAELAPDDGPLRLRATSHPSARHAATPASRALPASP